MTDRIGLGGDILAHTGEKVIIDPQGQPWAVGRFPLKEFEPGERHDYRVLAEGNHQRHRIDGLPTADVIDLDEKGRKLDLLPTRSRLTWLGVRWPWRPLSRWTPTSRLALGTPHPRRCAGAEP